MDFLEFLPEKLNGIRLNVAASFSIYKTKEKQSLSSSALKMFLQNDRIIFSSKNVYRTIYDTFLFGGDVFH